MKLREADREGSLSEQSRKKGAKLPDRCMEEEHPGSRLYEGHEVETYLAFSVKSEETKVN